MLERMRHYLRQWRNRTEVGRMSDRDIAELALSRQDLESLVRMPADVPDRMARMAAIHGLTEAQIRADRGEYLDLVETCGHCGERRQCAATLANAGSTLPQQTGFCPNSAAYAAKAEAARH